MTGFTYIANGKTRTQHNNCDNGGQPRRRSNSVGFVENGFEMIKPPCQYRYVSLDVSFTIKPGYQSDSEGRLRDGLIATHEASGETILIPFGTSPEGVKARLDEEIYEIKRDDAADDPPLDWQPDSDWADFEAAMEAEGIMVDF
jgi:hypothetical protein